MKTFVLTVSRVFPVTHKRKGDQTFFPEKILLALAPTWELEFIEEFGEPLPKIHTIRANYELWKKRIEQVQEGKAILSIRYWSGKPYNSKQVEICQLDKDSGIGVQSLQMTFLGWFIDSIDSDSNTKTFAINDGLSPDDFVDWFKGKITADMEPIAIIHFTKFRY